MNKNAEVIAVMKGKGFSGNIEYYCRLADEIYYGNIKTYGITETKNRAGINYFNEYVNISIVIRDQRFAIAKISVRIRTVIYMFCISLKIIEACRRRIGVPLMGA